MVIDDRLHVFQGYRLKRADNRYNKAYNGLRLTIGGEEIERSDYSNY